MFHSTDKRLDRSENIPLLAGGPGPAKAFSHVKLIALWSPVQ